MKSSRALSLIAAALILGTVGSVAAQFIADAEIRVYGLQVDVDTRTDLSGVQYTMSTLKNVPVRIQTIVGDPNTTTSPTLPAGAVVRATLNGPAFPDSPLAIYALPNGAFELPTLAVPGEYLLTDIALVLPDGSVIAERNMVLEAVVITVIDELLVTEVTSRPLSIDEIEERGIEIDQDNFTVLSFAIGMKVDSKEVEFEIPIAMPSNGIDEERVGGGLQILDASPFERLEIPNLSVSGFSLARPEEEQGGDSGVGNSISGLMIIPGNIAFLNQFFSVIIAATNIAPDGSGLVLQDTRTTIKLPLGDDNLEDGGEGDDPLRIPDLEEGEVATTQPLVGADGTDSIGPQQTNEAEFLVEGLREGTHVVDFEITGNLVIPGQEAPMPLEGVAQGVVMVRNPTFSINLSHPEVVREQERYRLFATVTNTSSSPANYFNLYLDAGGLMGVRMADGEESSRRIHSLMPGESKAFSFEMVSETTGKVSATVFLADPGINGSFLLRTGVGDTGIPLSPDTLVLPQVIEHLPSDPDVAFAAIRLLGQAYSVATAPAGSLPVEIPRISRAMVNDKAGDVTRGGIYAYVGEDPVDVTRDLFFEFLGADVSDVIRSHMPEEVEDEDEDEELTEEQIEAAAEAEEQRLHGLDVALHDWRAFDNLRRRAEAGTHWADVVAEVFETKLSEQSLLDFQADFAKRYASQGRMMMASVVSPGHAYLRATNSEGYRLGRLESVHAVQREIPFSESLSMPQGGSDTRDFLAVASSDNPSYTFDLNVRADTEVDVALILPLKDGAGLCEVRVMGVEVAEEQSLRFSWTEQESCPEQVSFTRNEEGEDPASVSGVVTALTDPLPTVSRVQHWAKGEFPTTPFSFHAGDPVGTLTLVLMSEEVERTLEHDIEHFAMEDNWVTQAVFQSDRRLVFLALDAPIGPFVERSMTTHSLVDLAGQTMDVITSPVVADPEVGDGAKVSGTVVDALGKPVPFASIEYRQTVWCPKCDWGVGRFIDQLITQYNADAWGRYEIDFALQNGWSGQNGGDFRLTAESPINADWGFSSTDVLYNGQNINLNIIIRGYGNITGQLRDNDGEAIKPSDSDDGQIVVMATHVETGERSEVSVASDGTFDVRTQVGNVLLRAHRVVGGVTETGITTVNIPNVEDSPEQDLFLVPMVQFATVSGRVLESDRETGVARTRVVINGPILKRVELSGPVFEYGTVAAGETDGQGYFSFDQVPTGELEVYSYRQSTWEEVSAHAAVEPGESIDVTLIYPGSGGTVTGTVLDAEGNIVEGAVVVAGPTRVLTDPLGRFEIQKLPFREIKIGARDVDSLATAHTRVTLSAEIPAADVVLRLEPIGSIRGIVHRSDGSTPVGNQEVQLWARTYQGGGGVLAVTRTDSDGVYAFEDVPVDDYDLRAVTGNFGDGGSIVSAVRFAGDIRENVNIRFRGLGSVEGRVMQELNGSLTPIKSPVSITREVWRVRTRPGANPENNYYVDYVEQIKEIDGVDAGIIEEAFQGDYTGVVERFFMLEVETVEIENDINVDTTDNPGAFEYNGPILSGPVTVRAGNIFTDRAVAHGEVTRDAPDLDVGDLVLRPTTGSLSGRIVMPDGVTLLDKAAATVTMQSRNTSGSMVASYGEFDIAIVPSGGFSLTVDTGAASCDGSDDCVMPTRLYGRSSGWMPSGSELSMDVRLHGVADVQVRVLGTDGSPASGARVELVTASSLDQGVEYAAFADGNGMATFRHVIEGRFSVRSEIDGTPHLGMADGIIEANPAVDRVVPVTVIMDEIRDANGQLVSNPFFGTLRGTVLSADGSPLTRPAEVVVRAGSVRMMTTSDMADGTFSFEHVPGGEFALEVFEPFSARRGFALGTIASSGEVVVQDVTLVGIGNVSGKVSSFDGGRDISNAQITIYPLGNITTPVITLADNTGRYFVGGLPLGPYRVVAREIESGLQGEALGILQDDGQTMTTDVLLQPVARLSGSVLAAGTGDSPAAFVDVRVVTGSFQSAMQTDAEGRFVFSGDLPLGSWTIVAQSGASGVVHVVEVEEAGPVELSALRLQGLGSIRARLVDSDDKPVTGAEVTVSPNSQFQEQQFGTTDGDGVFTMPGIAAGSFSLYFSKNTGTLWETTVSGTIAEHGQLVDFGNVTLDVSGAVGG